MDHLRAPRFELPRIANLDVLVIVKSRAEPLEIVAGVAQLDVAATRRTAVALELDHVVVDVRSRRESRQPRLVGLEQFGVSLVGDFTPIADHRELTVVGEQFDETRDVALPDTVAITLRQLPNRLAIGQLHDGLLSRLRHGSSSDVLGGCLAPKPHQVKSAARGHAPSPDRNRPRAPGTACRRQLDRTGKRASNSRSLLNSI